MGIEAERPTNYWIYSERSPICCKIPKNIIGLNPLPNLGELDVN